MCGIAGYSLTRASAASIARSRPRRCSPAIAERGADAVGYAYRAPARARRRSYKQRSGASALLERGRACPRRRDRAAHPRPRLHEGPPVDRGEQPPGPARAGRRRPQRDHRQRRRAARRSTAATRAEPRDDRRLRGDLRARRAHDAATHGRSSSSTARWPPPGSTSASRDALASPAASAGRSGSARAATGSFFASTRHALELVERYCGLRLRKRELREGTLRRRSRDGEVAARKRFAPDRVRRGATAAGRARAAGARVLPARASRRSPPRSSGAVERPSEPTADPVVDQALADEELERRPRAAARVEHAVDLPLGEQLGRPRGAPRPSRRTSAAARAAARARRPARPRARAAPPPPARRSPPRAARSRASRTCASRATSTASRPRCSSRSRAVGVRPSSSPSSRSSAHAAPRASRSGAARGRPRAWPRSSCRSARSRSAGARVVSGSAANSRIVGERPSRSAHARSSSRICSSV